MRVKYVRQQKKLRNQLGTRDLFLKLTPRNIYQLVYMAEKAMAPHSQCSCLENPRDGVAQSRTRLKWRSSSVYGGGRGELVWRMSEKGQRTWLSFKFGFDKYSSGRQKAVPLQFANTAFLSSVFTKVLLYGLMLSSTVTITSSIHLFFSLT